MFSHHSCLPLHFPPILADVCYNGSGESYRGATSVTRSGYMCQRWNSNYPHQHLLTASDYPELSGGHSYCRNPGGREKAPYCYTMNENVRTEECAIPKCGRFSKIGLFPISSILSTTCTSTCNSFFLSLLIQYKKHVYSDLWNICSPGKKKVARFIIIILSRNQ